MAKQTHESTRVGIVGLGYIGTVVGEGFVQHPDGDVVAVCDVDGDRLELVGDRFSIPPTHRYREYESMLEDAPLDAVLVGTPHTVHYEQVVAAMDHGLAVYCDKPLAVDPEHAKALAARTAHGEEPTLMVGYQRHLQKAFRHARKRYRDREPTWVTASITQDWIADSAGTWRLEPSLSGGGFLADTGSHVLDGVCWTTGLEPESVRATMDFHDDEQRIDRRAHLDVRFSNGATGTFSFLGDAPAVREHVHIWDDEGAVYLEGKEWGSRRVFEIERDSSEHHPYIDPRHEQTRADAFLESVREGTEPPATARDALTVTALTQAAYESARTGERIDVDLEV
ncbi:Gfo/Idh/MocA family protein [Natrialbaceae archaeon A-chndr2]